MSFRSAFARKALSTAARFWRAGIRHSIDSDYYALIHFTVKRENRALPTALDACCAGAASADRTLPSAHTNRMLPCRSEVVMQDGVKKTTPAKVEKRKYRSTKEIVNRILDAAMVEFKANGFERSTTANISKRAGVVEPQIFRHFGSKSNLFRSAIFETLSKQLDEISKEYHWEETGLMDARRETGSVRHTERLQEFLLQNSDLIKSLFIANAYGAFDASNIGIDDSLANYFQLGTSIMERQPHAPGGVPPHLMVRISFGAILGCVMFRDWLFPPGLATETEIMRGISQFVFAGLDASHPERARTPVETPPRKPE